MKRVLDKFGSAQGWHVDRHPRTAADVTGDGLADIVGFGDDGVMVSLAKGNGRFAAPRLVVRNFAQNVGDWKVDLHTRVVADTTGDGRADIVGFGRAGVWVALAKGGGAFSQPKLVLDNFGVDAGGWLPELHIRVVADTTGDGRGDIVGFGNQGVWVALAKGGGTFAQPKMVLQHFAWKLGWKPEHHPRLAADTTGDGRADLIGFGDAGVWVALAKGGGTFAQPKMVLPYFAIGTGGWEVEIHPRFAADTTGDGRADIVGFGDAGVWVANAKPGGGFGKEKLVAKEFGTKSGWSEQHPRCLADVTGDKRADIVGFGDDGVYVGASKAQGGFSV